MAKAAFLCLFSKGEYFMKREEIWIRDPFILVENDTYYMYGTTDLGRSKEEKNTFSVYISHDLEEFEGPFPVFDGKQGFWADRHYWAAEVWKYRGSFYLFGSFKAEGRARATQILKADSPMGPFVPISDKPTTPENWECLDGTFFEEDGKPYMVFCHEWLQCENGEMCAVELTPDLSGTVGEPIVLFRAGDNPAVDSFSYKDFTKCMVTDGPFLFRKDGKIHMIWSSNANGKYAVLEATADTLLGAWEHHSSRFDFDGGHAMLFQDLKGQRRICLHSPNAGPMERAVFLPVE